MNIQEDYVIKSLLLVLPAALLVPAPVSAAEASHQTTAASSGRSVSHDAREAWFRQSVGDILEGRAATPPKHEERH